MVKVLVIDDDPAIVRLLRLVLMDAGFTVSTAGDGRQALQKLAEGDEPDVVILDLQMPVLDGPGFLSEARAHGGELPPVLLLSANGARAAAARLDVADAMDKPFQPEVLTERVRKLADAS